MYKKGVFMMKSLCLFLAMHSLGFSASYSKHTESSRLKSSVRRSGISNHNNSIQTARDEGVKHATSLANRQETTLTCYSDETQRKAYENTFIEKLTDLRGGKFVEKFKGQKADRTEDYSKGGTSKINESEKEKTAYQQAVKKAVWAYEKECTRLGSSWKQL